MRDRHKNVFSPIDVQLQRHYGLIPNLVETANGYAEHEHEHEHEHETLEAVISARNETSAILFINR